MRVATLEVRVRTGERDALVAIDVAERSGLSGSMIGRIWRALKLTPHGTTRSSSRPIQ